MDLGNLDATLCAAGPADADEVAHVLIASRLAYQPFAPSAHPPDDVRAWVARTPSARLVELDDGHELVASIERIWDEARVFLGVPGGGA